MNENTGHLGSNPRWTGVLLLGGCSARMGQDKLRMRLPDGNCLAERAASGLAACCGRLFSVRQRGTEGFDLPGFEELYDREAGGGPLAGLMAALERLATPWLLVAGGDMPELDAGFLTAFMQLAERDGHRALLIGRGRNLEALPLAIPACLSGEIQHRFSLGERSLQRAVPADRLRVTDPAELQLQPEERPWLSLNTPNDWQAYTGEGLALPV